MEYGKTSDLKACDKGKRVGLPPQSSVWGQAAGAFVAQK